MHLVPPAADTDSPAYPAWIRYQQTCLAMQRGGVDATAMRALAEQAIGSYTEFLKAYASFPAPAQGGR